LDLINADGKIEETKIIKTVNGIGSGSFDIGFDKEDDKYLLRAYTNYTRNFGSRDYFRKVIFVENGKIEGSKNSDITKNRQKINFEIFPEGGHLVQGLPSTSLVYSTDLNGNPFSTTFDLMEDDIKLSTHQTDKIGFAKFMFNPKKASEYTIVKDGYASKLETSIDIEVNITSTISQNNLIATIHSITSLEGYFISVIKGKNQIESVELNGDRNQEIEFDLNKYPSGNLRLIILNHKDKIVLERYVFNHIGINNYNVDFELDAESYNKRELVTFSVDIYNDEGESLPGNYSISIAVRFLNKKIINNHTIRTSTVLSNGTSITPTYLKLLIEPVDEIDIQLIDNLMIIEGFSSNEIINSKTAKFSPENKMSIKGKIHQKGYRLR